jgi:hypothetical protein
MGFSHSLTNVRDLGFLPEPALSIAEGVEMTREKETGVRSLRHGLCEWARISTDLRRLLITRGKS